MMIIRKKKQTDKSVQNFKPCDSLHYISKFVNNLVNILQHIKLAADQIQKYRRITCATLLNSNIIILIQIT